MDNAVNMAASGLTPAASQVLTPADYVNKTGAQLKQEGVGDSQISGLKKSGKIDCETCKNRRYVDGSNDPGVSFKTPQKMTPAQAASGVMAHEQEHVSRNATEAKQNNAVASSSVKLFTSVCPECSKSYVSGGETRTVTKKIKETQDFANDFFNKTLGGKVSKELDTKV